MNSTEHLLYGADPAERIVAIEFLNNSIEIYKRNSDDSVESEQVAFTPWLLTNRKNPIIEARWQELEGDGLSWLAEFDDWRTMNTAREMLREQNADFLHYHSAVRQYMMRSGKTLFKGMSFNDPRRMQIDIETVDLSPHRDSHKILMIAITDNRGYEELIEGEEREILEQLVQTIKERDPDVIEGHNIFGFDLYYINVRAQRLNMSLALGRDGSDMTFGFKRSLSIGGSSRNFTPIYIYGRHIQDTLFGVQRFDGAKGELESYGLKEVARALGVSEENRILLDRKRLHEIWVNDPELVKAYCLQDTFETSSVAEITLPTEFYQTQMIPDSYQNCALIGTGEKINLLMIRAYLNANRAIPRMASSTVDFEGGHTEVRKTGIIHHVVKADVESLYPSIMLEYKLAPKDDALGVFLPMLAELKEKRLSAKAKSKSLQGKEAEYWDGLQASYKILINSFFGYLGAPFHFNDTMAAGKVTEYGRDIARKIADELEQKGAIVIEIDTDGVYFQPPDGIDDIEKEIEFINQVGMSLPHGIKLLHDGRYKTMISLKIKNYALLTYDGKKVLRGAALRSRADEYFGRRFLSEVIDKLLKDDYEAIRAIYLETAQSIQSGLLPVRDLSKRERITEKTFSSQNKKRSQIFARRRSLKVGDYAILYMKRDGTYGDPDEFDYDEDRGHYLEKLYKFALRLKEAFGDKFNYCFPKPGSPIMYRDTQPTLDLFDE